MDHQNHYAVMQGGGNIRPIASPAPKSKRQHMPWGGSIVKKNQDPSEKKKGQFRENWDDNFHHNKNVFNEFWKQNINREQKFNYEQILNCRPQDGLDK
ncbi:hypothetical protein FGO68_gene4004 [Halteria grandinella]|uniref:Uncharacterized protein n=1 Tax=Halteria grandinella TaxID=5974 RepID=A0A8J8P266_HALGN|nr:hypothetical protein FGO68_gene4004 [Halteria grandinella]